MRIAVAGATGNIGARTVSFVERDGHEVIRISRSLGVDLITGRGLDAALAGVDAVVDAISSPPISPDETREYFGTTTRNLLAAEGRAACDTTYCCRSSESTGSKAVLPTTRASASRSA